MAEVIITEIQYKSVLWRKSSPFNYVKNNCCLISARYHFDLKPNIPYYVINICENITQGRTI